MDETALSTIVNDPAASALYAAIIAALTDLGPFEVEAKKTSLHITNGRAFLGVHPRRGALLLNIVTTEQLHSPRVRKAEHVSANRWHNEVLLAGPSELDSELRGWLAGAYALTA